MKRCLAVALGFLSLTTAMAQLRVELSFEQETFLPHEPIYAEVRIYNSSGQTLVFGKDNDWLTFTIETVDGWIIEPVKPLDTRGEFTLPSASRARKVVNLAEAYRLTQFGRYNVTAAVRLRLGDWSETFRTRKPKQIGITMGVKLWETNFGLPSDEATTRPEIRKYQLIQSNHLKQLSLYARVTDESEAETYALIVLGPLVGFSRPEPQLDRWSNLHVLYQSSGQLFKYHMITPEGLLLSRETWEITDTRPALRVNSEGRITVAGGARRISASDLPPPELLSESAASAPEAAPTRPEPAPAEKEIDAKKRVQ